jgi:hypothetical protein
MKVSLVMLDGTKHPVTTVTQAAYALVDGLVCPACSAEAPLKVRGTSKRIASHDTYEAAALTLCCSAHVGTLRAVVTTLFGLEEDEAVLVHGRARVYGPR